MHEGVPLGGLRNTAGYCNVDCCENQRQKLSPNSTILPSLRLRSGNRRLRTRALSPANYDKVAKKVIGYLTSICGSMARNTSSRRALCWLTSYVFSNAQHHAARPRIGGAVTITPTGKGVVGKNYAYQSRSRRQRLLREQGDQSLLGQCRHGGRRRRF